MGEPIWIYNKQHINNDCRRNRSKCLASRGSPRRGPRRSNPGRKKEKSQKSQESQKIQKIQKSQKIQEIQKSQEVQKIPKGPKIPKSPKIQEIPKSLQKATTTSRPTSQQSQTRWKNHCRLRCRRFESRQKSPIR